MPTKELTERMNVLRARLQQPHDNPESLHDDVRQLLDDLQSHRDVAPPDLRESLDQLEAEILEDLHDNLPV